MNDATETTDAQPMPAEAAWSTPQPLTFTGSGSEYFRIWIVNQLLMLVTLGLYYPWAKARRLRYFHANTRLGDHAFSFHGEGRSMMRGFALVGVLLLLVSVSGKLSLGFGLLAAGLLVAAAPMLLRLSLQFRLSQTGWRGLRFSFDGSLRQAARAASLFLVIGFYVLVSPLLQLALQTEPTRLLESVSAVLGIGVTCLLAFLPMGHRALLAYRQGHVRYAGDGSVFSASVGAFYAPILLCLLVLLPFGLLAFALPPGFAPAALLLLSPPLWLLCLAVWRAGIQNAVWSGTRMPQVVIESRLSVSKLVGRYVLNALGMIVTLGLYWPFAAVATARLRLSAVSVSFGPDFERGIADPVAAVSNAGGDAAADLTGLDLGL